MNERCPTCHVKIAVGSHQYCRLIEAQKCIKELERKLSRAETNRDVLVKRLNMRVEGRE